MQSIFKGMSTIILASAVLTGCQSMSATNQSPQLNYDVLQSYDWKLVEAKDATNQTIDALFTQSTRPLTLNFVHTGGQDIISLNNTCNRFSAPYTVDNGNVEVGYFATTMMACPEPEASFDRAAARAVTGKYSLHQTNNNMPVLKITNSDGSANFEAVVKK